MTTDLLRRTALAVLLASSAACSGAGAEARLAKVAETVGRIRSGILDMRLELTTASAPDMPIGFGIRGPFEVRDQQLKADLRYRQMVGAKQAEVRFVAANGRAVVGSDGSYYELPVSDGPAAPRAPRVLQALAFQRWALDPRIIDRASSGEVTIVSPLDGDAALLGIGRLVDELDMEDAAGLAGLPPNGENLIGSVRRGTMIVRAGRDGLLRSLTIRLRFTIDPVSPIAEVRHDLTGAELVFSIGIDDPNEPIRVELPRNVFPLASAPRS